MLEYYFVSFDFKQWEVRLKSGTKMVRGTFMNSKWSSGEESSILAESAELALIYAIYSIPVIIIINGIIYSMKDWFK